MDVIKKDTKKPLIIGIVVCVFILVAASILIVYANTPEQRIRHQLNLGNRYLSELEYERAIACFETVITIDKRVADAYIGLAEGYAGLGDSDSMLSVYNDARERVGNEDISRVTDQVVNLYIGLIDEAITNGDYEGAYHIIDNLNFIDLGIAQSQRQRLNEEVCKSQGHIWTDATCTEPRTCTRCGLTEGSPLGHIANEADYCNPSICSVCGEEIAPALIPYFVENDIPCMEPDKTYTYFTTYVDEGRRIPADVEVHYIVVSGCDKWYGRDNGQDYGSVVFELPEKEGYVWEIAVINFWFDKTKVAGATLLICPESYYGGFDDHVEMIEQYHTETVTFRGVEYEIECLCGDDHSSWTSDGSMGISKIIAIHVPEGYDGCVLMLYNGLYDKDDANPIVIADAKDTLFFHMD